MSTSAEAMPFRDFFFRSRLPQSFDELDADAGTGAKHDVTSASEKEPSVIDLSLLLMWKVRKVV